MFSTKKQLKQLLEYVMETEARSFEEEYSIDLDNPDHVKVAMQSPSVSHVYKLAYLADLECAR